MPDLLETADTRAANSPSADKPASVSHQVRESNAAEFVSDEYVETAEAETDAWRKELQEELGLGLDDVNGEDEEDVDCLLYTSDAADEEDSVDLGGRRIIKKKKRSQ
eukprot:TRINITY_DN4379_c0_g1_i5.p1 TRINITY_DN4379_c0_g1~~TRINITY_DN4379_c0_g1_i5.p1  ORF type:complete len:107 (+),score=42.18 TRINITY_DN4379_c0_g1_i5:111-431(+)